MPAKSPAQERLMQAAAHAPGGYGGVPRSVGKEFTAKDYDMTGTSFFDAAQEIDHGSLMEKLNACSDACAQLDSRMDAMECGEAEKRIADRVRGDDWSPEAREAAAKAREGGGSKAWTKEAVQGRSNDDKKAWAKEQERRASRKDNYVALVELPTKI